MLPPLIVVFPVTLTLARLLVAPTLPANTAAPVTVKARAVESLLTAETNVTVAPLKFTSACSITPRPDVPPVRFTSALIEVMLCPKASPLEPTSVIVPEPVVNVPVVASVPPLLRKSMLPVPVLKLVTAGKVSVVPAIAVIPVFAPSAGAANVNALLSVTETLVPVLLSVTAPMKSFVPVVSVIGKGPVVKLAAPVTNNAPLCVIAPPAVTLKLPLTLNSLRATVLLKSNVTLPAPLPPVVLRLPLPLNVVPSAAKLPPLVATAVLTATAAPWIVTAEVKLPSKLVMVAEFVPPPALIVRDVMPLWLKVTVSLVPLEIFDTLSVAVPESVRTIVSLLLAQVKTRFVGERLSVIGSRPV